MKYEVTMPSLGADMDEGKLMEWKIKVGDDVKKNQVIASVETTKSVVDIESYREGKVLELIAKVGEVVAVGKTIGMLEIQGEEKIKEEVKEETRMKISPAARKLAEESGIDLSKVKPTGSAGEITLKDLGGKSFSGINLRQAIASAMSRSKKEIPHYYLKKRVHIDSLMSWLDQKNNLLAPEERLLMPAVLMRSVVVALKKYPQMNGRFENNKFTESSVVNLGSAFSLKDTGVIAPAVLEAENMSLQEFNRAFLDLATRVKNGGLKNREFNEGTITVTNIGDLGSDEVFGIIFPPQVSILGFGRIRKEPIFDQGQVRAGFVVDVTLGADHRVSDGLIGARFLNEIDHILNNPNDL